MQPYEYCSGGTDTVRIGVTSSACDFPFQPVEKGFYSERLQNYRDVAFFLDWFNVTYDEMLSILASAAGSGDEWIAACEFLQNSSSHRDGWVQRAEEAPPVLFAILFFAYMVCWSFLMPHVKRCWVALTTPVATKAKAGVGRGLPSSLANAAQEEVEEEALEELPDAGSAESIEALQEQLDESVAAAAEGGGTQVGGVAVGGGAELH